MKHLTHLYSCHFVGQAESLVSPLYEAGNMSEQDGDFVTAELLRGLAIEIAHRTQRISASLEYNLQHDIIF